MTPVAVSIEVIYKHDDLFGDLFHILEHSVCAFVFAAVVGLDDLLADLVDALMRVFELYKCIAGLAGLHALAVVPFSKDTIMM